NLKLPYKFSGRIDPTRLAAFDDKARGRGTKDFLKESIRRLLSARASEESATKWSAAEERAAPESVVGELAALGLTDVSLIIGRAGAPPEVAAAGALAELRKRTRETGRKILLIGLDGADWQIIDPLIKAGKLPTLARLKSGAAWANLKSMQPIL